MSLPHTSHSHTSRSHISRSDTSGSRTIGPRRTLGASVAAVGITLTALALPAGALSTSEEDGSEFGHTPPARVERVDPAPSSDLTVPVRPVTTRPVDVHPEERPDADVEILRLECRPATQFDNAVGCAWGDVTSDDAVGYQLWRIVDRGERELVWRGGLDTTTHLDRVPGDSMVVRYAILAVDEAGEIVARSRAERVVLPTDDTGPVRPVRTVIRSIR